MIDSLLRWMGAVGTLAAVAAPMAIAVWPRDGKRSRGEAVLLAGLLSIPLLALLSHVFLAGVPMNAAGFAAVYVIHVGLCYFARRKFSRTTISASLEPIPSLVLYFAALASALFVFALTRYTIPGFDSAFYWMAKAWAFVHTADAGTFDDLPAPAYPLGVPFVSAFFLFLRSYAAAAMWQHLFLAGALLLAMIELARRRGGAGMIAGAALLIPQLLFVTLAGEGNMLYADTTLAAAMLVSAILLSRVLDGDASSVFPAALMMSFAALVKVNAAPYLAIVLMAFAFILWRRGSEFRDALGNVRLASLLNPIVVALAWLAFIRVHGVEGSVESIAGESIRSDILGSGAPFAVLFYRLELSARFFVDLFSLDSPLDPRFFTYGGWVLLLVPISLFAWRALEPAERFLALASSALLVFIVFVMYALVRADDAAEADWWFRTGYLRAVVHAWPMAVFAGQLILARVIRSAMPENLTLGARAGALLQSRKQFVAAAMLPLLFLPLLYQIGVPTRGWEFLRLHVPVNDPGVANEYGLYWVEAGARSRSRWTKGEVRLPMRVKGRVLVLGYSVGHPEISDKLPVIVEVEIGDLASASYVHDSPGEYERRIELPEGAPAVSELRLSVTPTFGPPTARERGVLLHPLVWTNSLERE